MSSKNKEKRMKKKKVRDKCKKPNMLKNLSSALRAINKSGQYPIYECLINDDGMDVGMVNLLVSKRNEAGDIILAAFLVDMYCLGVKDCFIRLLSLEQYNSNKALVPYSDMKPEDAKKLLFDVVNWSKKIGFEPHTEYKNGIKIFEGIHLEDSDAEFKFGIDGKPSFFLGPNDSPEKCEKILKILQK